MHMVASMKHEHYKVSPIPMSDT